MVELKEKNNPLGEPFSERAEPETLRQLREESWKRYEDAGIPTVKHEEWKYTSLRAVAESTFASPRDVSISAAELAQIFDGLTGAKVVFVNGAYRSDLSDIDSLPDGVQVSSFVALLASDALSFPERFGKIATLEGKLGSFNDERFANLNNAQFSDGALIRIGANKTTESPIHLFFLNKSGSASIEIFPRVWIELEEGAKATVGEHHIGLEGTYFTGPVAEVSLAKDATIEHIRLQHETESAFHIGTLAIEQAENSTYRSTTAAFGARISRLDTVVWVGGEHAETSLNGVYVGDKEQVLDNHTRIDHAVPNCHSFEIYKGILSGKAQGVFNGKIFVYKDAQKTDAKQTNQALLLSKTAGVNTKPQLEIFADDVKCTHGATVGQLREDAMFYLRARGIPKDEARNILVHAFAAAVFEGIGDEAVRGRLEHLLFGKLDKAQSAP